MGNSSVATAAPNGSDKVAPTTITTPVRETPAVCLTNYSPFFSYIYQPRSARRWGAGISETLSPTMASPIPREAFATDLGPLLSSVAVTIAFAREVELLDCDIT